MRASQIKWRLMFVACCLVLLMVTACHSSRLSQTPLATSTLSVTQDSSLDANTISSLSSLEKLDDYPFYVMNYYGNHDYPQIGGIWPQRSNFSCSLFASLASVGDMFYGRNFDWEFSPALLVFTDPADGYASASMVDLTFLGIDPDTSTMIQDLPLEERVKLMSAPSMPFDGMNEFGLVVGMAALPDEFIQDASYDPSRPSIGSIGIIRQVLDHARDVDEAAEIFGQYNIDFRGGPPIHYLLADPSGKAILIEFYRGEMIVIPNDSNWHLATNHLRVTAQGDGGCLRYHTMSDSLTNSGGQLDEQGAMQLLSQVRQGITQWSAVYNMSSGDIQVVIHAKYQVVYTFHLALQIP